MALPITVLIPTHGRPTLLRRTLRSLEQCELPECYRELMVIENGSRAGAEEIVEALPQRLNARYLHIDRGNKCVALNKGLAEADEGLVVFFDDDIRLKRNVLVAYAEAARGLSEGVFFGGPTKVDYEQQPPDWLSEYLPMSVKGLSLDSDSDYFLGFNWAAFRSDIMKLGGFNSSFGPGSFLNSTGDENDMQQRLLDIGIKKQPVPDACVWHYVSDEVASPRWTISRRFRDGVRTGIKFRRSSYWQKLQKAIFNSGRCILSIAKRSILMDGPRWWRAMHTLSYNLGTIYGFARATN